MNCAWLVMVLLTMLTLGVMAAEPEGKQLRAGIFPTGLP